MKIPKLSLAYKIREKTIAINMKMLYGYKRLSKDKLAAIFVMLDKAENIIHSK